MRVHPTPSMAERPPPPPPRRSRQVLAVATWGILVAAGLQLVHLPWWNESPPAAATPLAPGHHLALTGYMFAAVVVAQAVHVIRSNRREAALRAQSITDPLTGLCNRRYFTGRLTAELSRSRRAQTPLALLLVDIDHLKAMNDQGGHTVGDQVIRSVAQSIVQACRSTDVCARLGGDEFAILAPSTNARQAVELANRLRSALRRVPAGRRPVTASIGVSDLATAESASPEALLGAADGAMYRAKQAGRDRVVVSDPQAPAPVWAPLPTGGPMDVGSLPPYSPHGPH